MKTLLDYILEKQNEVIPSSQNGVILSYTNDEVISIIEDWCTEMLDGFDLEIVEIWLNGSRARGTNREDSDLDALMFYKGSEREDDVFNALHDDDELEIDGIKVDINPKRIRNQEDIDRAKSRSRDYDAEMFHHRSYN